MQRDAKLLFYMENRGAKWDPGQTVLHKCYLMQESEQKSQTEC